MSCRGYCSAWKVIGSSKVAVAGVTFPPKVALDGLVWLEYSIGAFEAYELSVVVLSGEKARMRGSGVRLASARPSTSFSLISLFFVLRLSGERLTFAFFPFPFPSLFQLHLAASVSSDQRECDLVRMLNDRIIGLNTLDGLSTGRSADGDSSSSDPA